MFLNTTKELNSQQKMDFLIELGLETRFILSNFHLNFSYNLTHCKGKNVIVKILLKLYC